MALTSSDVLAGIFHTLYPASGTVMALTHVPRAYSHQIWRVDTSHGRFALRIARLASTPQRVANALAAQRLATANGVPTPRILAHDDGALFGLRSCRGLPLILLLVGWRRESPPCRPRSARRSPTGTCGWLTR